MLLMFDSLCMRITIAYSHPAGSQGDRVGRTIEPGLAEKVAALAVHAKRGEVVLRLAPLVVAEVVWVLGSFYGQQPAQRSPTLSSGW